MATKKPIPLPEPKKCPNCSAIHTEIPADHRVTSDPAFYMGYYFECACKSTVFIALGKIVKGAA